MRPSVGRIVLVCLADEVREVPAIVVAVNDEIDGDRPDLNVRVFPDSEIASFHLVGVRYGDDPYRPTAPTWRWPPRT